MVNLHAYDTRRTLTRQAVAALCNESVILQEVYGNVHRGMIIYLIFIYYIKAAGPARAAGAAGQGRPLSRARRGSSPVQGELWRAGEAVQT